MSKKISILYVDDEPINLMLFNESFKKKYIVEVAESGMAGLEKLHSNTEIRVVISDMKMPGMNGIEFISKAKSEYPNNIYLILTGYNITEEIADALNNKLILKYFRKPFDVKAIDESIEQSMEQSFK
jgi:two-component system response regulator (stage 0 sporulation protein F)